MRKILIALVFMLGLVACGGPTTPEAPRVESDNDGASFALEGNKEVRAPVDDNVYTMTVQVVGDVESLTRQTERGEGSISGYNGYVSGSSIGPKFAGKGFVRGQIISVEPTPPFADVGDVALIKTSDTKAAALRLNDVTEFKCRAQFEAVAPIKEREKFDLETYGTWEFDFCRMTAPVIGAK